MIEFIAGESKILTVLGHVVVDQSLQTFGWEEPGPPIAGAAGATQPPSTVPGDRRLHSFPTPMKQTNSTINRMCRHRWPASPS